MSRGALVRESTSSTRRLCAEFWRRGSRPREFQPNVALDVLRGSKNASRPGAIFFRLFPPRECLKNGEPVGWLRSRNILNSIFLNGDSYAFRDSSMTLHSKVVHNKVFTKNEFWIAVC